MTLTLELPSDLEEALADRAANLGLSVPDYELNLLIAGSQPLPAEKPPRTGAELVEYWMREGVVGSRPDIGDSLEHAQLIDHGIEHLIGRYRQFLSAKVLTIEKAWMRADGYAAGMSQLDRLPDGVGIPRMKTAGDVCRGD